MINECGLKNEMWERRSCVDGGERVNQGKKVGRRGDQGFKTRAEEKRTRRV